MTDNQGSTAPDTSNQRNSDLATAMTDFEREHTEVATQLEGAAFVVIAVAAAIAGLRADSSTSQELFGGTGKPSHHTYAQQRIEELQGDQVRALLSPGLSRARVTRTPTLPKQPARITRSFLPNARRVSCLLCVAG